jgi:hypothetical protein
LKKEKSSLSDFEGLKLDILPRNHALNMQRERDRFGLEEEEEEEEVEEERVWGYHPTWGYYPPLRVG